VLIVLQKLQARLGFTNKTFERLSLRSNTVRTGHSQSQIFRVLDCACIEIVVDTIKELLQFMHQVEKRLNID
jgi:hypothetical protein